MDFMGQYQTWRNAKNYETQNPNLFQRTPMQGWGGGGGTIGDGMISNRGLGGAMDWQAKAGPFGGVTPEAQGYAKYKNDMGAETSMVELAGYLERTKGMNSNNVLKDLAAGNVDRYASYIPEFTEWRGRETTRRNATGMMTGTFAKLLTSVGPALVTGGAALPMMGRIGMGAAFGGMSGGPMGALTGGVAAGLAPSLKLPGIKSAFNAPIQAAKSVASQMTPLNLLKMGASKGVGSVSNTAPAKSAYQANLFRSFGR